MWRHAQATILRRHIEKLVVAHIGAPVHFHQLRCLVTVLPEAIGNILAVQKPIAVLIGCKRTCDFFHLRLRHTGLHTVCARQLPFLQELRHIIRSVVRKRRKRRLFDVQLRMAQKNRLAVLHIKAERVLPKTGRCTAVRERCGNGKRRRRTPAGGFRQREKPQAAKQDKATGSCAPRGDHICPPCGQIRGFARGEIAPVGS